MLCRCSSTVRMIVPKHGSKRACYHLKVAHPVAPQHGTRLIPHHICIPLMAQSLWKNNGPHWKHPRGRPTIVQFFTAIVLKTAPKRPFLDTKSAIEPARRLETQGTCCADAPLLPGRFDLLGSRYWTPPPPRKHCDPVMGVCGIAMPPGTCEWITMLLKPTWKPFSHPTAPKIARLSAPSKTQQCGAHHRRKGGRIVEHF